MAAERQDALREFVAVTGAEEDRARFFLESAGWDLQVAARGRLRRAGGGLREAGVWRSKPAVAEAHSHPAGLRPDPGLRVPRPLATRRQLGWAWENAGRPRPGPALLGLGFPLRLARSRGQRDFGQCGNPRGERSLGAWRPRRGSAGSRPAGMTRSGVELRRGRGDRLFPFIPPPPRVVGEARPGSRPTPPPTQFLGETTSGVVAQPWSLFGFPSLVKSSVKRESRGMYRLVYWHVLRII